MHAMDRVETSSGFHDAFARFVGAAPTRRDGQLPVLEAAWLETPIGPMIAIASDDALHLLEFVDRRGLQRTIERLRSRFGIVPGRPDPVRAIEGELAGYFAGSLSSFAARLSLPGTRFQRDVWDLLREIPRGATRSYAELAAALGAPRAVRAVARANGANQLAIVIPCHRVVRTDGGLGGYGGGAGRKAWLLEHERKVAAS